MLFYVNQTRTLDLLDVLLKLRVIDEQNLVYSWMNGVGFYIAHLTHLRLKYLLDHSNSSLDTFMMRERDIWHLYKLLIFHLKLYLSILKEIFSRTYASHLTLSQHFEVFSQIMCLFSFEFFFWVVNLFKFFELVLTNQWSLLRLLLLYIALTNDVELWVICALKLKI